MLYLQGIFLSLDISRVLKFDFCLRLPYDILRSWKCDVLEFLCWGVSVNFA